ncbi:MAG: putative glycoside hydrolase [Bacteroides sp.]|nr:putative glycoside hydrolase [Bacteroides sp.]
MKRNKSIKIKRSKSRLYKKKKSTAKVAVETIVFVLIAGCLVFVGYSAAGPLINLWSGGTDSEVTNWTPEEPDTSENGSDPNQSGSSDTDEIAVTDEAVSEETGIYLLKESDLNSSAALSDALKKAKEAGFKQVLIPLKNDNGDLLYKSGIAAVKDTELVIGSLPAGQIAAAAKNNGLTPKAIVPALLDNNAPSYVEDAGYRFADDSYFWLDAAAANGGKRWLDPFLSGTRSYYSDMARELTSAGFEEVVLSQLRFPAFTAYDQSILDGRSFTDDRHTALTALYNAVNTASGKKTAVAADIKDVLAGYGQGFSATAEILNDKTFTGTLYLTVRLSDFDNRLEIGENKFIGLSPDPAQKAETLIGKAAEYIGTNVTVAVVIDPDGLTEEQLKECYGRLEAE